MSLYNNYYDGLTRLKKSCGYIESPANGSVFFGVRYTYFDDIDQSGTVYQTVYKFKRELNPNNKVYYDNFRLKANGDLYKKPSSYGWIFFQTKAEADNFIITLKVFVQQCIKDKIKILEEQIDALN